MTKAKKEVDAPTKTRAAKKPALAAETAEAPTAAKAKKVAPTSGGSGTIKVRLVRSPIGYSYRQKAIVAGLGLRKLNQVVERKDTVEIRGMVAKISHLVSVLD